MIQKFNYFLTGAFDLILTPFRGMNDFWPVLFLSVILSFVILYILKFISFPRQIVEAKEKIKANIFAIRIYKDFWKVIVSSFFKSMFHTLRYFVFNLAPFLVIIPLLTPVFSQMEVRYGMRPFQPGETFVLKAVLDRDFTKDEVSLVENEYVRAAMRPVFINAWEDEEKTVPIRVANWKMKTLKEGTADLTIRAGGKDFSKSVKVGNFTSALSDRKYRDSGFSHFLYPVEPLLEDNDILKAVKIHYPGKLVSFLGIRMHWLLWNIIIVVVLILGFRKRFGVEF